MVGIAESTAQHTWRRYRPTEDQPWNVLRVVHLHRRAGFGATWREVQRDLSEGPTAAVTRLLKGNVRIDGVPDDFAAMADLIGDAAAESGDSNRLKAWWIYRMLSTPDPLTEKLTLMWHNHFATSNLKVADLRLMRAQNEIFRRLGGGPFRELLGAVVHDPAMLIWLDADSNRKGTANENLARELMELFTLGIGNYTEQDIREGARALTGWTLRRKRFYKNLKVHDGAAKTILGQTGNWRGDDFVRILLEHPATALRLAARICSLFFGEGVVAEPAVAELASRLRHHDLDIRWGVETVLRSRLFFDSGNIASRICDPLEFVVGNVRALELFQPPPSTILMAEWAAKLGQDLFYPPNVGGWSGGRDWLSSRSIVARANYGVDLVEGKLSPSSQPLELDRLCQKYGCDENLPDALAFYDRLLLGSRLRSDSRRRILTAVDSRSGTFAEKLRLGVALMFAFPEFQLA